MTLSKSLDHYLFLYLLIITVFLYLYRFPFLEARKRSGKEVVNPRSSKDKWWSLACKPSKGNLRAYTVFTSGISATSFTVYNEFLKYRMVFYSLAYSIWSFCYSLVWYICKGIVSKNLLPRRYLQNWTGIAYHSLSLLSFSLCCYKDYIKNKRSLNSFLYL